jgi:hypothetical protein
LPDGAIDRVRNGMLARNGVTEFVHPHQKVGASACRICGALIPASLPRANAWIDQRKLDDRRLRRERMQQQVQIARVQ